MSMTTDAIDAVDLVMSYDTGTTRAVALECARLRVKAGSSLAIMGPTGCGKSTLLGLLAGLSMPTAGCVRVAGHTVSAMTARERGAFRRAHVGMVFQNDNLLPHLTVLENVTLQGAISRVGVAADAPTALLRRVGLDGLEGRLLDQLSGGQRQRVAVARAIVHQPEIILADEPTGALDAATAHTVISALTDAQRAIGATLVVVTHDPAVAAHLDTQWVMPSPTPDEDRRVNRSA